MSIRGVARRGRWLVVVLALMVLGAGDLRGQTRADSAAVLLNAAEQLRLRGEAGAARALLNLITQQYAGTPASQEVERMLALLRRMPEAERSGRTELLLFGALYGAWLGVAVPLALDSEEPAAFGVGLLLGAPAGFLGARQYVNARSPTYGQTRALTFGGMWGTANGFVLAEILDWGSDTQIICPDPGVCFEEDGGSDGRAHVAAAVAGGLLGVGTGALLARRPISAGAAATTTLGGMWGSWFGLALSYLAGQRDDALLTGTMIGGNASLLAAGLLAPRWRLTESRARLISVGGLIGAVAAAGLLLIVETEDDDTAIAVPLTGSVLGLGLAAYWTRNREEVPEAEGRGALINRDGARWAIDMPTPSLTVQRADSGSRPAAYIPLLRARF